MSGVDRVLLERAKQMRSNLTPAEQKLWFLLRAHRFDGFKFARQVVIAPYIVDFATRQLKLIIEIDGHTHGETEDYDARRTSFLSRKGYRVVRFTNADVMANIEGVAQMLMTVLGTAPLPGPLPKGEREKNI